MFVFFFIAKIFFSGVIYEKGENNMNIAKISNQNFNGSLYIKGYTSYENKSDLRPTVKKNLDADSIKKIYEDDENVIISYTDSFDNKQKNIFLPYGFANKLDYYNLVLNAYNAAKSHPDINVSIPTSDNVINI